MYRLDRGRERIRLILESAVLSVYVGHWLAPTNLFDYLWLE